MEIVRAYRYKGELLLEAGDGSVCACPERFNGFAEREMRPRTILKERPWQLQEISLSRVPSILRAPIKGQPKPKPLSENLTAQSINRKREASGLPPLVDEFAEPAEAVTEEK